MKPIWEKLTLCQYGTPHPIKGSDDCGEPAVLRVSLDGGKEWLYVCEEHTFKIDDTEIPDDEDPV